jgi:hypothetical protein
MDGHNFFKIFITRKYQNNKKLQRIQEKKWRKEKKGRIVAAFYTTFLPSMYGLVDEAHWEH